MTGWSQAFNTWSSEDVLDQSVKRPFPALWVGARSACWVPQPHSPDPLLIPDSFQFSFQKEALQANNLQPGETVPKTS